MIRESITGLDGPSFQINMGRTDRHREATAFEKAVARFYKDVVASMPIREVSRLPQRFAQENEEIIRCIK